LWLHSLKVAQLLRSAACLHTNQSRSYLNHLVLCAERQSHLGLSKVSQAVPAHSSGKGEKKVKQQLGLSGPYCRRDINLIQITQNVPPKTGPLAQRIKQAGRF